MNAELARINNTAEDDKVYEMMLKKGMATNTAVLIGLTNINMTHCCTWIWQDGSPLGSYNNWARVPDQGIHEPNGEGNCVDKSTYHGGKGGWADYYCSVQKYFACDMAAQESCDPKKIMKNTMQNRMCVTVQTNTSDEEKKQPPDIDIFLDPTRKIEKDMIIIQNYNDIKYCI